MRRFATLSIGSSGTYSSTNIRTSMRPNSISYELGLANGQIYAWSVTRIKQFTVGTAPTRAIY